ncbi:MAG: pentapeptide repeat-containing protein [Candidatus Pacebacteria bacterium]|nr:pentapeptide repeat-containing protein [Candidatus Paceibacterota bacterium]
MANITRSGFQALVAEVNVGYNSLEMQKIPLLYLYPNLDIRGLNLSGLDLLCLNFDGMDLTEVNFSDGDLYGTSFYGATLRRAKLRNVTVQRPPGNHAHDWFGADFTYADLTGTNLTGIEFKQGWSDWRKNLPPDSLNSYFRQLYWKDSPIVFDGAKLVDVDLRWTHLEGVSFIGADMTRAKLAFANFQEAQFERAIMKGAYIEDTNMEGANMRFVSMNGVSIGNFSNLSGVDLTGAVLINLNNRQAYNSPEIFASTMGAFYLTGANCTEADMRGGQFAEVLVDVNFTRADLARTDFSKVGLRNCNFTDANICGANISNFGDGEGLVMTGAKFDEDTKLPKGFLWVRKNGLVRV